MTTQIVCRHCGEPIERRSGYINKFWIHKKSGFCCCFTYAEPLPAPTGEGMKEAEQ